MSFYLYSTITLKKEEVKKYRCPLKLLINIPSLASFDTPLARIDYKRKGGETETGLDPAGLIIIFIWGKSRTIRTLHSSS